MNALAISCQRPGCNNTVEHRATGRRRQYCSNDCRIRAFRGRESCNETPPSPNTRGLAKSSARQVSAPNNSTPSESSDDCPRIVVMLDSRTRVIAADVQWILQERHWGRHPWRGKFFCRSKAGLLLYAPKPTAREILSLPDWFPRSPTDDHFTRPDGLAPMRPTVKANMIPAGNDGIQR